MSNLKLNLPILGLCLFFSLYALDPFSLIARTTINLWIPLSSIAYLISFILLIHIFLRKKVEKKYFISLSLILIFTILSISLIITSKYSSINFVLLVIRYLLTLAVGYYTFSYICNNSIKEYRYIKISYIYIITLLITLIYLGGINFLRSTDINYLRLADGVAVTGILLLSVFKNYWHHLVLTLLFLIALYLFNSRSALILFPFISLFMMYYKFGFKRFIVSSTAFIVAIGYTLYYMYTNLVHIHSNRLVRLLFYTEEDTSLNIRENLLAEGWSVIQANVLFGKFGWQIEKFGNRGSYIHSVLEYWAQFGLIAFLIIILLLVLSLYTSVKNRYNIKLPKEARVFNLSITVFIIINVILAKSFVYEIMFLTIGINMYLMKKNNEIINSSQ